MPTPQLEPYLRSTAVIDWHHPAVLARAHALAADHSTPVAIAQTCFTWVRDRIHHSGDAQMNPVTWRASDVLQHQTGYCFAKSHLLAALLRANHIPAGFCYQRLSIDDQGAPYSLHGFNGIYLADIGWYRVDARGNRPGLNAQFSPPQEQLAYPIRLPAEADFPAILPAPLPLVVTALQAQSRWDEMLRHLPDVSLAIAPTYGLMSAPPL